MSTDKTQADVQPGGRVRLGDQAELDRHEFQAWTRELLPCPFCGNSAEFVPYKDNGLTLKCKSMGCIQRNQRTLRYGIDWLRTSMAEHWNTRALSAQPSPGGQDALPPMPACRDRQPDDMPGYMESALDWVRDVDNCDAVDWLIDNHAAIRAALAARQPVGEPVAVVVPGAPTRCKHCESTDLEWFAHVRAVNDVPHGRLTTHDVGCVFVLGCQECSETLRVVKADEIAALLNAAPPAQDAVAEVLRELLTERQHRTDGDLLTLADRCRHLSRGDKSCISMQRKLIDELTAKQAVDLENTQPLIARSLAEWHEDDGNVLWWAWCGREWAGEPAWAGTPNDSDWPGYHTHFTPHPNFPIPPKA